MKIAGMKNDRKAKVTKTRAALCPRMIHFSSFSSFAKVAADLCSIRLDCHILIASSSIIQAETSPEHILAYGCVRFMRLNNLDSLVLLWNAPISLIIIDIVAKM